MGTLIKYRLKVFLKHKVLIFWTLIFPILLGTIFNFVLKDIETFVPLDTISVAVVHDDNPALSSLLEELSNEKSDHFVLRVTHADEQEAMALLEDKKVSALLFMDETPRIYASKGSYETVILKSIINSYTRVYSQVQQLVQSDPSIMNSLVIDDLFKNNATLHEKVTAATDKEVNMIYFYNIIAMVCLYGALWGVRICSDAQATQSKQAARVNVSPVPKWKILSVDFSITYTIIMCEMCFALVYLNYVLGIEFGSQLGLMLGVMFAGSFASLSIGTFIGTFSKMNLDTKIGLISAITILLNFLSGMMASQMLYFVDVHLPFLRFINPADLIVRGFTMVYYFSEFSMVYVNIGLLALMGIIFFILAYTRIRRVSYASI